VSGVKILRVELTPSQYPAGETVHRLLVAGANRQYSEAHIFNGSTSDGQALIFAPTSPMAPVQFVRVGTTVSPSWVAWREIEVIDAEE